jgi:hypothetical protein
MTGPVAHLNVIRFRFQRDAPGMVDFRRATGAVLAVAERAPGFLWRLPEGDPAPANDPVRVFGTGDRLGVELSVWATAWALDQFTHQSLHGVYLRRRAEWAEPLGVPSYVIWPVAEGHLPTLEEGRDKLAMLTAEGPGALAFDFDWFRAQAGS